MAVMDNEAAEHGTAEAPTGAFMIAASLILVAVGGIAYWSELAYRRWWRANHPFAGSKARVESVGTTYRQRRADLAEVAQFIGGIVAEIARATEHSGSSLDRAGP